MTRPGGVAALAIAGFALVAVIGVLLRPALPIDETRYLSVAWEMAQGGSFLVPHKNGAIYSDKPPLLFWLINLVWRVGGVSELAARLVAPAFGGTMLALTWVLGRRLWPAEGTGPAAAAVLAGMLGFQVFAGLTMFDTLLGTATLLGLLAILRAARLPGWSPWAPVGAALALGVLAKGPVILFHLGPALLSAPLWVPGGLGWRRLARGVAVAVGVAAGLVALWVVPAILLGGPEYRDLILWKQSSGRVVSSFAHARPWWFIIAALPLMLFPWVWMPGLWSAVPAALRAGPGALRRLDRGVRLCVIWAAGGLALFSAISGKQLHYVVPELPAAALLIARSGVAGLRGWGGGRLPAILALIAAMALAATATGLLGPDTGAMRGAGPLAAAMLLAAAGSAAFFLPALSAGLVLGMAVVLTADIAIRTTGFRAEYDAGVIGGLLAPHQDKGLAVVTDRYNAEFNFAGRLSRPLDVLAPDAAQDWLAAHPGGMLATECTRLPSTVEPTRRVRFYGEDWCLQQGGS